MRVKRDARPRCALPGGASDTPWPLLLPLLLPLRRPPHVPSPVPRILSNYLPVATVAAATAVQARVEGRRAPPDEHLQETAAGPRVSGLGYRFGM
jgi:hypothetical protein